MINDLLAARKPINSVQGEKKEEMLIPGWNSYDIIFVPLTLTEPSKWIRPDETVNRELIKQQFIMNVSR